MPFNYFIPHQTLESSEKFLGKINDFFYYLNRIIKKKERDKKLLSALKIFFEQIKIDESQAFSPYFLGRMETNYRYELNNHEDSAELFKYIEKLKEHEQLITLHHEPAVRMEMLVEIALEQYEHSPLSPAIIENFERIVSQRVETLIRHSLGLEKSKEEKLEALRELKEEWSILTYRKEELDIEIQRAKKSLRRKSDLLYKSLEKIGFPIEMVCQECSRIEKRIHHLLDQQEDIKKKRALLLEKIRAKQEAINLYAITQTDLEKVKAELQEKIKLFTEKQAKKSDVQLYDDYSKVLQKYAKALEYLTDNYQSHLEYIRFLQSLAEKKYHAKIEEEKHRTIFEETPEPYVVTISPPKPAQTSLPETIPYKRPKRKLATILSLEEYNEKYKRAKKEADPQQPLSAVTHIVQNTWWENFKMAFLELWRQLFWISLTQAPIIQVGLFAPKSEFNLATRPCLDTLEPSALI
jgi:hypothetical protein